MINPIRSYLARKVKVCRGAVLDKQVSSLDTGIFSVLIVEQSRSLGHIYKGYLDALFQVPSNIQITESGHQALTVADKIRPDLILLDLSLDDISGDELVSRLRSSFPDAKILGVAVQTNLERAVEAVRVGATDVLIKPLTCDKLRHAIQNLTTNFSSDPVSVSQETDSYGFIGQSPAMRVIYKTLSVAAPSTATVFITGESGTGKELYAEAIHRLSGRAGKSMISLNCSAIPRDLMESEIFGHVRGAFTGATDDRDGAAILADGGTLFLDEICEMDLDLQAKLLRFVQTSTVQKVGQSRARAVDVRFVCATNRDLAREVACGRFREDLYYRLFVIPVHLPALREREGDVRLLAQEFLSRFATAEGKTFTGIHADALFALEAFDWPGNVRQLENLIQNIVVMNPGGEVTLAMLRPERFEPAAPGPTGDLSRQAAGRRPVIVQMPGRQSIHDIAPPRPSGHRDANHQIRPLWIEEREIIERAIQACDGNTVLAAALLGVSPSTLYRKRKTWARADRHPRQDPGLTFSATG